MGDVVKMDLRTDVQGVSRVSWKYEELPEGLRAAKASELVMGMCVLYQVLIGPDLGWYYSDYVTPRNFSSLVMKIRMGYTVWIR